MFNSISAAIAKVLIAPMIFVASLAGYNIPKADAPVAVVEQVQETNLGAFYTVGAKNYYLSGSGVGSTDTTVVLTSFKIPVSDSNLTMANFGEIGYATIDPSSPTRQEFISFTGITQNANGTADLTGVTRGLMPVSPYTASSTYRKAHPGGSVLVISNSPQIYNEFTAKKNDETITGSWSFPTPTVAANPATKGYTDALSFGAIATSTESAVGFVELATQLEMASSTALGGTGAPVVVQAKYATSTAPASGYYVPLTGGADGNLAEGFLPTTLAQNYTLSGANTFSSTNTFSATTTMASTTFNGYVQFNARTSATTTVVTSSSTLNLSLTITGSTTVKAHGFGAAPSLVKISGASGVSGSGGANRETADAQANWSTASGQSSLTVAQGSGSQTGSAVNNSFRLYDGSDDPTQDSYLTGVITVDATNVTLTWTETGTVDDGTGYLIWEIYK